MSRQGSHQVTAGDMQVIKKLESTDETNKKIASESGWRRSKLIN